MYTMGAVLRHGSAEQKARYLPKIASGELRLQAFGVTEPTSGTDTTRIRTFARREGDRYIVNGQKIWISRAEHSDLMLLLCRTTPREESKKTTDGMTVLLVDMREAIGNGLTIRPIRTMLNHATTELFFDNLAVPVENRIGEEGKGFRYILDGMNAERILIASECIGDGRFFVERATGYARTREVFGRPIGAESGRPVSDRPLVDRGRRGRAYGGQGGADVRGGRALRNGSQHRQAPGLGSQLEGGRHVRPDARRLRLRRGVRHRAQVSRDAALSGGADLDQSHPRPCRNACPRPAEILLMPGALDGVLVVSLEQAVAAPFARRGSLTLARG